MTKMTKRFAIPKPKTHTFLQGRDKLERLQFIGWMFAAVRFFCIGCFSCHQTFPKSFPWVAISRNGEKRSRSRESRSRSSGSRSSESRSQPREQDQKEGQNQSKDEGQTEEQFEARPTWNCKNLFIIHFWLGAWGLAGLGEVAGKFPRYGRQRGWKKKKIGWGGRKGKRILAVKFWQRVQGSIVIPLFTIPFMSTSNWRMSVRVRVLHFRQLQPVIYEQREYDYYHQTLFDAHDMWSNSAVALSLDCFLNSWTPPVSCGHFMAEDWNGEICGSDVPRRRSQILGSFEPKDVPLNQQLKLWVDQCQCESIASAKNMSPTIVQLQPCHT